MSRPPFSFFSRRNDNNNNMYRWAQTIMVKAKLRVKPCSLKRYSTHSHMFRTIPRSRLTYYLWLKYYLYCRFLLCLDA